MTTFDHELFGSPASRGWTDRLPGAFGGAAAWNTRKIGTDLSALNDHMLRDIGLRADEIPSPPPRRAGRFLGASALVPRWLLGRVL